MSASFQQLPELREVSQAEIFAPLAGSKQTPLAGSKVISQTAGVHAGRGTQETTMSPVDIKGNYKLVPGLMTAPYLDDEQKVAILRQCPDTVLNELFFRALVERRGCLQPEIPPPPKETTVEGAYAPDLKESEQPPPNPDAPKPIYPAYSGRFQTALEAKAFRRRTRVDPKAGAPDVEHVKLHGRQYWVRRIYEAMIDISDISDGNASVHRQRFTGKPGFDPADLEATAHHVFDSAIAVHERGWTRPKVYHKKVVRGKLADISENSIESRLARICLRLKQNKATVDDAVRGGVTLALLCDNPEARGSTKLSNNAGNKKRGERLKMVKGEEAAKKNV